MRVLVVEDEPYMAEAIRDGLRLEAIAADIAGDGDAALELLRVNAYEIAVLDRDIPGPSGDDVLGDLVAARSGDVAIEDGDVVRVHAQQLQRGAAITGDVGRDRFQA